MPPIKLRYALDRKRKVGAMAGLRFYVCLLRGDDSEHLGTRFYADCATARPPAIRNPRPRANVKIGKFFPNEMKSAAATPPCLSRRKHCVAHCVLFFLSSFCSGPLTGRGREGYNRETGWIERITRPQIGQKAQKNERKGFSNVLFLLPILPPPPPPPPPSPSVGRSVPAGGSDVARRRENPSIWRMTKEKKRKEKKKEKRIKKTSRSGRTRFGAVVASLAKLTSREIKILTCEAQFLRQVCIVQKRDSTGNMYAMKYVHKNECAERGALKNMAREVEILSKLEHPCLVNLWFSFQGKSSLKMFRHYFPASRGCKRVCFLSSRPRSLALAANSFNFSVSSSPLHLCLPVCVSFRRSEGYRMFPSGKRIDCTASG